MGTHRLSHRRLALLQIPVGSGQLLVVPRSDLVHASLAVKPLSDCFVRLHKLIQFLCQFIILTGDNSDVIIQAIDLNLEIGIIVKKR